MKGYDYSWNGLYFVTLYCNKGLCLFGEIEDEKMIMSPAGLMVGHEWCQLLNRFKTIRLHEYVIMPNHFHAIIEITGNNRYWTDHARLELEPNTKNPFLGEIIGAFKSLTTVKYIRGIRDKDWPQYEGRLWLRNYWERIIRIDGSVLDIAQYIKNNPSTWTSDCFYKRT